MISALICRARISKSKVNTKLTKGGTKGTKSPLPRMRSFVIFVRSSCPLC